MNPCGNRHRGEGKRTVWLTLFIPVVFETVGDACMKLSEGFVKRRWALDIAVGCGISFYLMAQVLTVLPVGVTYAIWSSLAQLSPGASPS